MFNSSIAPFFAGFVFSLKFAGVIIAIAMVKGLIRRNFGRTNRHGYRGEDRPVRRSYGAAGLPIRENRGLYQNRGRMDRPHGQRRRLEIYR